MRELSKLVSSKMRKNIRWRIRINNRESLVLWKPLDSERCLSTQSTKDGKLSMLMLQYRGNQSQYSDIRLRKLTNVQVVFTTRKLESCLPSLKSAYSNDLKSRVVYKLSCSGCTSTYVGQAVRQINTRIEEHKKADSPVGPPPSAMPTWRK